jgi:hypothetical protein
MRIFRLCREVSIGLGPRGSGTSVEARRARSWGGYLFGIFWAVSRAVQLTDPARGMTTPRWPTLSTWVQQPGARNLRDMYQGLTRVTRQYLPEGRPLRESVASFLYLVFPPTHDQRASPRRAAPRRKFRTLSSNTHADSPRQRTTRRRAY